MSQHVDIDRAGQIGVQTSAAVGPRLLVGGPLFTMRKMSEGGMSRQKTAKSLGRRTEMGSHALGQEVVNKKAGSFLNNKRLPAF